MEHMNKKILLIDMDGVLVDLDNEIGTWLSKNHNNYLYDMYKDNPDHIPGVFRFPKPIEGAIDAIHKLNESGKYDMFIATTASWENPESSTDKRYWIEKYFGKLFEKRMFVTHRKDMLVGDILIDDRIKNGAGEFKGEFIHFGWDYENKKWNEYPNWDSVLEKLL